MSEKKALVATPAGRDRAIERLQEHLARNNIDLERFEQLVEMAERATTDAQLLALFDGLPEISVSSGAVTSTINATFSAVARRGRFSATQHINARAVFGSIDIDLSEVELSREETILDVTAWFGSVTITVPEGLAVDCEGSALFGSFDQVVLSSSSKRDSRRLKIRGTVRFSSVDIVIKKRTGVLQQIGDGIRALLGGQ
jgi:hypothetical protein